MSLTSLLTGLAFFLNKIDSRSQQSVLLTTVKARTGLEKKKKLAYWRYTLEEQIAQGIKFSRPAEYTDDNTVGTNSIHRNPTKELK